MPITGSSDFRLNCYILKEKKTMKYFIVRPKAKPVRRNRRKSARKLLGLSMTAGLVLLVGSAGALDCGAIPAGQAFVQAAFGLALFGGCGLALRVLGNRGW